MVNLSIFEKLPAELHDLILEPLTLYDLINLSQVSRHFHNLITPRIYNSWTYNGRQHSSKSLQRFLRTVLENPQLGSLADTLDLREWGDCPRLEDDCHTKWYSGQGYSYQDFRPDEDEGDDSETDDGRQEAADDGDNNLEASKDESPEPDGPVRGNKTDEMYKEYIPLFQKAIEEIGFGECTGNYTTCHKCRLLGKDEDVLISLLIWSLPNLHTLYLVMPSDSQSDCTLPLPNAVTGMMARAVASGRTDFLQNLRTIYVCSALYIGAKGHRMYKLDFEDILPFFKVKSLQSLFTLTTYSTESAYRQFPKTELIDGSTSVSELVFEEAAFQPEHIPRLISMPKVLKRLSWSQGVSCFSPASCYSPVLRAIGEALQVHKASLESLSLDIRQAVCRKAGHFGRIDAMQDDPEDGSPPLEAGIRKRRPTEHLIGRLDDFHALKSLSISNYALCGDRVRGLAPYRMIDALPRTLETLKLFVCFSGSHNEYGLPRLEDTVWVGQLMEVVESSHKSFPRLRNVAVSSFTDGTFLGEGGIFARIRNACSRNGIAFETSWPHWDVATQQPYFQTIVPTRRPGRDY